MRIIRFKSQGTANIVFKNFLGMYELWNTMTVVEMMLVVSDCLTNLIHLIRNYLQLLFFFYNSCFFLRLAFERIENFSTFEAFIFLQSHCASVFISINQLLTLELQLYYESKKYYTFPLKISLQLLKLIIWISLNQISWNFQDLFLFFANSRKIVSILLIFIFCFVAAF